MKKAVNLFAAGILLICSNSAFARWPLESFILTSTREDNRLILEILKNSELEEALTYGALLGERADPDVEEILSGLMDIHAGRDQLRVETIMRAVIQAVFFDKNGGVDKAGREANQEILHELFVEIARFQDSGLTSFLLYLFPENPEGQLLKTLLRQGECYIRMAEDNGGFFPGEYPDEVIAFFHAAAGTSSLQLYSTVKRIYMLSRDEGITSGAKRYLKRMESGISP